MAKKKAPEEGAKKVNNPNVMGLRPEVLEQPITETLELNYMPYAMSVIVSRAIPEIDGFKPSHRKLLYTMYQMHLLGGARTKSANVVGAHHELNPHGDAAIYDTMVRLSRGYGALLHPLVDSKGNFGKVYSRDMAWAASRYTEVRLDPICAELFRDIDQDTVDFVDNYDGSMKEPTLLPTTFPNVLVSANQGIAVGMASNLCGFKPGGGVRRHGGLSEAPQCQPAGLSEGPRLPHGGELLYDEAALSQIYETGRGSFQVRARWRYLKSENLIEIYEIPYTTTVEAIMDKVAELVKAGKVKEISDMRDETDLNGLKITIDLKRGADPDKLMARLFRSTTLQDSFSCNFNILIAGMPRVMGVRQILEEWTAWRMEGVRRRTYFVMKKKQDKLHLLKGLKKILLDIDKAIKIIRETEEDAEVVPNLMIGFGIDACRPSTWRTSSCATSTRSISSSALMRWSSWRRRSPTSRTSSTNPQRVKKLIVDELQAVKKKYALPRRTEIVYEAADAAADEPEDETPDYPVHVFCSREGYFKKITPQSLRMSGEQKYKEGDGPYLQWEASNRDELAGVHRPAAVLQGPPQRLRRRQGQRAGRLSAHQAGHGARRGLRVGLRHGRLHRRCAVLLRQRQGCPGGPVRLPDPDPPQAPHRRLLGQVPPGGGSPPAGGHGDGGDLHRGPLRGVPHRRPQPQDHPLHPGGQRDDPQAQVPGGRRPAPGRHPHRQRRPLPGPLPAHRGDAPQGRGSGGKADDPAG